MPKNTLHSKLQLFDYFNYTFMIFFSAIIIYPLIYLFALSLSSAQGLITSSSNPVLLFPRGFTLDAYTRYFKQTYIVSGYISTLFRVIVGTSLSICVMSMAAYALSKKNLPFRRVITYVIVFTMFFNGGLIPTYLNIKSLGLIDNRWVLVLPVLFNTFYMLILRNFFMEIPEAIQESARIDGAGDLLIFFKIILPQSIPAVITIILWLAVDHWNAWFDSMIYISDFNKQVIQMNIRRLVIEQSKSAIGTQASTYAMRDDMATGETMRAAALMITILPMLCVYPFIQRFFVKGVIVGSVKG